MMRVSISHCEGVKLAIPAYRSSIALALVAAICPVVFVSNVHNRLIVTDVILVDDICYSATIYPAVHPRAELGKKLLVEDVICG